jgi:anion-transporting  ArsA/GET3 family ATPase
MYLVEGEVLLMSFALCSSYHCKKMSGKVFADVLREKNVEKRSIIFEKPISVAVHDTILEERRISRYLEHTQKWIPNLFSNLSEEDYSNFGIVSYPKNRQKTQTFINYSVRRPIIIK